MAKNHGIDFIRIGVTVSNVLKALPYLQKVKKLGMEGMVNFMKSYANTPAEFAEGCRIVNDFGVDCVYLVDSAGCMLPEDVELFYETAIEKNSDIQLG